MKFIYILLFALSFNFLQAQKYVFIPDDLHELDDSELNAEGMVLHDDLLIFNEYGKKHNIDKLVSVMANPKMTISFYGNAMSELKAVVFRQLSPEELSEIKGLVTDSQKNALTGKTIKDFIAVDMDGNQINIRKMRDKVLVLNFWFIDCKPCRMEIPDLNELKDAFKGKNVEFIAISFDSTEDISKFLVDTPFEYRVIPNRRDIMLDHKINAFPTHLIIDKNGKISYAKNGYRPDLKSLLKAEIEKVL